MALSLSTVKKTVWGDIRVHIVDVTFDSSYPTGGESLTKADLGFTTTTLGVFTTTKQTGSVAVYESVYDLTNEKLMVYGVEQDADAATTEPFDQENDTANLSALVVRVIALGY